MVDGCYQGNAQMVFYEVYVNVNIDTVILTNMTLYLPYYNYISFLLLPYLTMSYFLKCAGEYIQIQLITACLKENVN